MKKNTIDFVVLWVDSNDAEWRKSKAKYSNALGKGDHNVDDSENRYRDWELFNYWFRGVEKFAPWVNKVHLVTCGHVPKWLNTDNPKLNVVKHSDIMPEDALPTFNSNAILLCVHNIPGLAEQFVLFNDDMFLTKKVKPTDFFKDGKPRNTMSLLAITPSNERQYSRTLVNNIEIINNHFCFRKVVKKNFASFLSLRQGKYLLTTIPLLVYSDCPGFKNYHIPIGYLKSTFTKVWSIEKEEMERTVHTRFRDYEHNVSEWVMNYWQFMSGASMQKSGRFGINIMPNDDRIFKIIKQSKRHAVCIGDTDIPDFELRKNKIKNAFDKILGEKSGFEK